MVVRGRRSVTPSPEREEQRTATPPIPPESVSNSNEGWEEDWRELMATMGLSEGEEVEHEEENQNEEIMNSTTSTAYPPPGYTIIENGLGGTLRIENDLDILLRAATGDPLYTDEELKVPVSHVFAVGDMVTFTEVVLQEQRIVDGGFSSLISYARGSLWKVRSVMDNSRMLIGLIYPTGRSAEYNIRSHELVYVPLDKQEEFKAAAAKVKAAAEAEYTNFMTVVKKSMEELLGADRFSFKCTDSTPTERVYELLIHYPYIEVTNTTGAKHPVKDLYVRIKLYAVKNRESVTFKTLGISACRMTVSISEYESNYGHSHVRSNAARGNFSDICFGSTSISNLYSRLGRDESLKTFIPNLEGFVMHLEEFWKWESMEGGPHCNINSIRKRRAVNMDLPPHTKDDCYKDFVINYDDFPISFKEMNGRLLPYVNDKDEIFGEMIKGITTNHVVKEGSGYYSVGDEDTGSDEVRRYNREQNRSFFFNDKQIKYKVVSEILLESEKTILKTQKIVAHPTLVQYVATVLNNEIILFNLYKQRMKNG